MKPSPEVACSINSRDIKVAALREFVIEHLASAATAAAAPQAELHLIARCSSSPVADALAGLSSQLREQCIAVRVVLLRAAGTAPAKAWPEATGFEVRYLCDVRLAEAHEQLILPDGAVWTGDSMRRDPERRDVLSRFAHDCSRTLHDARHAFGAIWGRASIGAPARRATTQHGEAQVLPLQGVARPLLPARN